MSAALSNDLLRCVGSQTERKQQNSNLLNDNRKKVQDRVNTVLEELPEKGHLSYYCSHVKGEWGRGSKPVILFMR